MLDGDEECAIHDYEAPFSISEYENLDELNEVAELDEESDLPRLAYLVEQGYNLDFALEHYEDVIFYSGMNLEDVACVFRRSRPPNPTQVGHLFR